jgi:alanine-synthesizing transaminase
MKKYFKSSKLENVCYDIRGPVLVKAQQLEEEGFTIYKLNTGNPPHFGINAPDEVIHDVIINLNKAEAYSDSKGMFSARKAIMQYYQKAGLKNISIEDIYTGNGASEMIVMAMQGLCNNGDEILIPSPDYPLWTAAVNLSGGKAVHYICDEQADWNPDTEDIRSKITSRTKAIVIITPNNPTGAVYDRNVLENIIKIAKEHDLILFCDEIYDKILYDDAKHYSIATMTNDVLCITINGLSKAYRIPGFRSGWMVISGKKSHAEDFIEGLNILASMRLCSNAPAQLAIQTSLGGYQSIYDLTKPGGRLCDQRDFCYEKITKIPGVSCVKPKGALYLFPKLDIKKFNLKDDQQLVYDLLVEEKVLIVQGTGFNLNKPDHVRIVFLPSMEDLEIIMQRFSHFLSDYNQ